MGVLSDYIEALEEGMVEPVPRGLVEHTWYDDDDDDVDGGAAAAAAVEELSLIHI